MVAVGLLFGAMGVDLQVSGSLAEEEKRLIRSSCRTMMA